MAYFQQNFGAPPLPAFAVSEGMTVIGRHENCDIIVDSPAVSRQHARILAEENRFFLEDLESRNGTILNGEPLRRKQVLNDGDRVEISTHPFTFRTDNSLSDLSGSWGVKAGLISVSQTGSDMESLRRQIVAEGDRLSEAELGTDSIRQDQVVSRLLMPDTSGGWPVTSDATRKLNELLRLIHALRQAVREKDVIANILPILFDIFPSGERIAIVINDRMGTGITVAAAAARHTGEEVEICMPLVRSAMNNSQGLLYVDHWNESGPASANAENATVRSILAVPLIGLSGCVFGAIQVDTKQRRHSLQKQDLELLVILNNAVSFALDQALAVKSQVSESLTERTRQNARELRRNLAPSAPPEVPGYRLANALLATPDIAADLVDYVRLADGRVASIVIDVPGRGPAAAGLSALLARLLAGAIHETGSATAAIRDAETTLRSRMDIVPMVISVGIMILDTRRSIVNVAVAGHCPVIHVSRKNVVEIEATVCAGPPLGGDREPYQDLELQLADNDVLILFTDGITKLCSPEGNLLNRVDRMGMLSEAAAAHRSVFDSKLTTLLSAYGADAPLPDDIAFVMINRTPLAGTADGLLTPDLAMTAGRHGTKSEDPNS